MARSARAHRGWMLVALLGGTFLGNVDTAIVNIAVPSIQDGLRASAGELGLVVSGYTLAYAVLLVTGARLGQIRGHRRIFLLGLGVFTLMSLACGLAPSPVLLILARIVQGTGAALMAAQVLTVIQIEFAGAARGRALAMYTAVLSAGAVVGQVAGGLLISADLRHAGWRPAFLIVAPAGAILTVLAVRFLPRDRTAGSGRLDWRGVVALSVALLLLVVPLVLGRDEGWPAWTRFCLVASLPAFAAFFAAEKKTVARGRRPVIDPRFLARPAVYWGAAAVATAASTYSATLFVVALYLQRGLGRGATYSGLALVAWVAAFGLAGPILPRLSLRSQQRAAPAGALAQAAGFATIALALFAHQGGGSILVGLLGLCGAGYGLAYSGLLAHLTRTATGDQAPDVSGLIQTASRVGAAIGVAAFGAAYLALVPRPGPAHAVLGFATVAAALAATALGAAGMAHLAVRGGKQHASATVGEASACALDQGL